jgi:hypothetical protein
MVSSPLHTTSLAIHDELLQDALATLEHPEVTLDQRRLLCTVMSTAMALREEARCSMPDRIIQDIVSQRIARPMYQGRPLTDAAIRQNAQARARSLYVSALAADGLDFPCEPLNNATRPIRYSDAYDDLIGTRSLTDGTAAAYAETYGDFAASARRHNRYTHNGLKFGQRHLHITVKNRHLIEIRQARALARLPTEDIDREIVGRVVRKPKDWGWLGGYMRQHVASRIVKHYSEELAYLLMEGLSL